MTHFVTDKCIRCKYTDCVEVCPVDCFYEGANMLVIDPDQCIDCGVCIPECPIDAIVPDDSIKDILECSDSELNEEQKNIKKSYEINKKFSKEWKNITSAKTAYPEAESYKYRKDKFKYFDENLNK
ncbi:ferredoxin family protein [Ehrlichia canis]|uniref:4Fe-4S ferredoxin, iron-sulfur binding domain n=1 Tax=Ehrlichia canis (strain Jake) TaxID=269484 RepID=A0ACA6AUZ9_EHRCJ|nr:ferredoxin family protein [Ehrlichia canis]AAZ68067.1 4Fe-4S ferredoxin, iron-sulfur binding domain [Ehrlichia canis str. Jake]AUO54326.1 ferredoxin family protein [Ehrlichia canis]UKC53751.1 ferredoxin family protein [Ehrlichia canis]UKC54689.1 ferredoxin family protein [Ehrlichia canis]UKC55625.1 ferredoxin family protein [Ehrlichia canis]